MSQTAGSPSNLNEQPSTPVDQYQFILASGSPRRRELLELLGLPFIILSPDSLPSPTPSPAKIGVDETPLPGEIPTSLVQRLSRAKAQAIVALLPTLAQSESLAAIDHGSPSTVVIIAADTIVVSEDKILGKPVDPAEATTMLKQLRQQQYHYVYSGLAVAVVPLSDIQNSSQSQRLITKLHQSKVWMRPYTDAEIEAYVASGDPLDKAGAYAIQNKSFAPVERLEGCFASVMGLPLGELTATLKEIGYVLPDVKRRCTQYSGQICCIETSIDG